MASAASFFKFMALFYSFKDGVKFENFILEPHFDINEGIGKCLGQIVKVLLELLILGVLKEELLLWQLALLRQILLAAQIDVHFGTVSQH